MGAILLLAYFAICVVVFKLLRVPLNQWTATTACVSGVVLIGVIMLGMNYNHPFTTDGRFYFYTTPIVPTITGRVTEVVVSPNVRLKKDDILYQIGPRPYQYAVDQKNAQLAEAKQNVKQLRTSFVQASAGVEKAKAQVELAQQNYDRQADLFEKKVAAKAIFDTAVNNLEVAQQTMAEAEAAAERSRLAVESQIGGVNTTVARLQAELGTAELDLAETTVRAPTDGYVTQMFLRPGMIASNSTPTMVFIHSDANVFSASFPQSALQRVRPGYEAEAAFDGVPGRVFKGKVSYVTDAISQGQVLPKESLVNPEDRSKSLGRIVAVINLDDSLSAYQLPAGATAQVAVYTEHWQWVAIIRRIILRMKAWLNYVI